MSFDDDETGVETSRPRELYTFVAGSTTYRYTSAEVDVVYAANTYTAIPIDRGATAVTGHDDQPELMIKMPVSSGFVQDNGFGMPPQTMTVTVRRLQVTSGVAIIIWDGKVTAISMIGDVAKVRSPSLMDDAIKTQVPSAHCQRVCNHVLYDDRCTMDRTDWDVVTTISAISGNSYTVTSDGATADQWFRGGEFKVGNEQRTILDHTGSVMLLDAPFADGVIVAAACTIYVGCDRTAGTCRDKFANIANFGGFPRLYWNNPFMSGALAWKK